MTMTTSASAKPTPMRPRKPELLSAMASIDMSHVHFNGLLHPPEPDDHHQDRTTQHEVAQAVVEQHLHVLLVDHVHGEPETDRQHAEHDGRHATFGRERLHVSAEPFTRHHG